MSVEPGIWRNRALALTIAAALGCWVLHKAQLQENTQGSVLNDSRYADDQGAKSDSQKATSDDARSPYNDAGGVKQLPHRYCYQREGVGECAARIVQAGVGQFYFYLVITSVVQAAVGVFTWYILQQQTRIIDRQAKISDKQATLAHQTYLTTNRPRLRIRNIVVQKTRSGSLDASATLFGDEFIVGQCYVVNIGATDAKIGDNHLIAYANQMGLPMERPYEAKDPNKPLGAITLKAGVSKAIQFSVWNPLTADEPFRARDGHHPLYIMGWISYSDDNGSAHRTAFCRQWDAARRRFVRLEDDPDYEHEE